MGIIRVHFGKWNHTRPSFFKNVTRTVDVVPQMVFMKFSSTSREMGFRSSTKNSIKRYTICSWIGSRRHSPCLLVLNKWNERSGNNIYHIVVVMIRQLVLAIVFQCHQLKKQNVPSSHTLNRCSAARQSSPGFFNHTQHISVVRILSPWGNKIKWWDIASSRHVTLLCGCPSLVFVSLRLRVHCIWPKSDPLPPRLPLGFVRVNRTAGLYWIWFILVPVQTGSGHISTPQEWKIQSC